MYDPLVYWEDRANDWLKSKFHTTKDWNQIKEYIDPEWRVLELGCGTGRWSKKFKRYAGVDISPTLVVEAKKKYPNASFFHHDIRHDVPDNFDLIFTFTAWLHVPPQDIVKVKLPDCNYLFVEPHTRSRVEYCFNHNYEKLFGVKKLKDYGKLTIYGKFINKE